MKLLNIETLLREHLSPGNEIPEGRFLFQRFSLGEKNYLYLWQCQSNCPLGIMEFVYLDESFERIEITGIKIKSEFIIGVDAVYTPGIEEICINGTILELMLKYLKRYSQIEIEKKVYPFEDHISTLKVCNFKDAYDGNWFWYRNLG